MRWLWDTSPLSRALKGLALNEQIGLVYHCDEEPVYCVLRYAVTSSYFLSPSQNQSEHTLF